MIPRLTVPAAATLRRLMDPPPTHRANRWCSETTDKDDDDDQEDEERRGAASKGGTTGHNHSPSHNISPSSRLWHMTSPPPRTGGRGSDKKDIEVIASTAFQEDDDESSVDDKGAVEVDVDVDVDGTTNEMPEEVESQLFFHQQQQSLSSLVSSVTFDDSFTTFGSSSVGYGRPVTTTTTTNTASTSNRRTGGRDDVVDATITRTICPTLNEEEELRHPHQEQQQQHQQEHDSYDMTITNTAGGQEVRRDMVSPSSSLLMNHPSHLLPNGPPCHRGRRYSLPNPALGSPTTSNGTTTTTHNLVPYLAQHPKDNGDDDDDDDTSVNALLSHSNHRFLSGAVAVPLPSAWNNQNRNHQENQDSRTDVGTTTISSSSHHDTICDPPRRRSSASSRSCGVASRRSVISASTSSSSDDDEDEDFSIATRTTKDSDTTSGYTSFNDVSVTTFETNDERKQENRTLLLDGEQDVSSLLSPTSTINSYSLGGDGSGTSRKMIQPAVATSSVHHQQQEQLLQQLRLPTTVRRFSAGGTGGKMKKRGRRSSMNNAIGMNGRLTMMFPTTPQRRLPPTFEADEWHADEPPRPTTTMMVANKTAPSLAVEEEDKVVNMSPPPPQSPPAPPPRRHFRNSSDDSISTDSVSLLTADDSRVLLPPPPPPPALPEDCTPGTDNTHRKFSPHMEYGRQENSTSESAPSNLSADKYWDDKNRRQSLTLEAALASSPTWAVKSSLTLDSCMMDDSGFFVSRGKPFGRQYYMEQLQKEQEEEQSQSQQECQYQHQHQWSVESSLTMSSCLMDDYSSPNLSSNDYRWKNKLSSSPSPSFHNDSNSSPKLPFSDRQASQTTNGRNRFSSTQPEDPTEGGASTLVNPFPTMPVVSAGVSLDGLLETHPNIAASRTMSSLTTPCSKPERRESSSTIVTKTDPDDHVVERRTTTSESMPLPGTPNDKMRCGAMRMRTSHDAADPAVEKLALPTDSYSPWCSTHSKASASIQSPILPHRCKSGDGLPTPLRSPETATSAMTLSPSTATLAATTSPTTKMGHHLQGAPLHPTPGLHRQHPPQTSARTMSSGCESAKTAPPSIPIRRDSLASMFSSSASVLSS